MANPIPLYDRPEIYARVFPLSEEETGFFAAVIGEGCLEGVLLDAACGDASLGRDLARILCLEAVGLDLERAGLAAAHVPVICGDLRTLPLADDSVAHVVSRLFGFGYEMGSLWQKNAGWGASGLELARVLRHGGIFALEIPLAHQPASLCGLQEEARIAADLHYRFRYLDVLAESPFGAVLDTRIEVETGEGDFFIAAPLHVWTPSGAREWIMAGGLELTAFYAPYDLSTETTDPPADCLRAVVKGRKAPK